MLKLVAERTAKQLDLRRLEPFALDQRIERHQARATIERATSKRVREVVGEGCLGLIGQFERRREGLAHPSGTESSAHALHRLLKRGTTRTGGVHVRPGACGLLCPPSGDLTTCDT